MTVFRSIPAAAGLDRSFISCFSVMPGSAAAASGSYKNVILSAILVSYPLPGQAGKNDRSRRLDPRPAAARTVISLHEFFTTITTRTRPRRTITKKHYFPGSRVPRPADRSAEKSSPNIIHARPRGRRRADGWDSVIRYHIFRCGPSQHLIKEGKYAHHH